MPKQTQDDAKIAYFDCFSGISGDMTLGALVHLGVPLQWLKEQLAKLSLSGFDLTQQTVMRSGIQAVQVTVSAEETHHHRHYQDIRSMITGSSLPDGVKENSLAIFDTIATAEAKIHGVDKASVHFHEVGAVDAIVDIVGACLGLHYLKIDRLLVSALPLGGGFVTCEHGTLPVPAPATLEIVKEVPVYTGAVQKEMVTPTGAGIVKTLADAFGPMPELKIEGIGYGAGTREFEEQPNLLRLIVGRAVQPGFEEGLEQLIVVETNIDDMNPELFGYLMEQLFDDGALDVSWLPVQMKKNRPGTLIQVLCEPQLRSTLIDRILMETTSLGVRFYPVYRKAVQREIVEIETVYGPVSAKRVTTPDGTPRIVPEFETCRNIATANGVALREVYDTIVQSAKKNADN